MSEDRSEEAVIEKIVAFATHLSDPAAEGDAAVDAAKERGWLDGEGRPTDTGRDLAKAIDDQRATRSAIRNL